MKLLPVLPIIALCFTLSFAQIEDYEEWADFDYQHAGLTQTEFQNVRESGMSKEKLMYLLEIGVRPSVYLKEPWEDLGVSEEEWLKERASGMSDEDIDRTYKNYAGNQSLAYWSFLVPSLYQWSADEMIKAIAMDVAEVSFIGLTVFLYKKGSANSWLQFGVPFIAAVHLWSGIDALLATQWDSNPDVRNFSWGILPTGKNSFAAGATLRF
jgi:hypothetical protein